MNKQLIVGKNSVIEAIKFNTRINKILVSNENNIVTKKIINLANEYNINVEKTSIKNLDYLYEGKHQGIIALVDEYEYATLDDVFLKAEKENNGVFIIILDHIQDPHNLGAIIRSACICGSHGIIIPKKRRVEVTPSVLKIASGGCEHTPIVQVSNITETIKKLQSKNIWIYSACIEGKSLFDIKFAKNIALVIGAEDKGISHLVKQTSDFLLHIPTAGAVTSFNASVACGIIMAEVMRQRLN